MFCYQCQETAKNEGCTIRGVCGKTGEVANLQDLLIYVLKGISICAEKTKEKDALDAKYGRFIIEALFATITNVNFDEERIVSLIREGLKLREELKKKLGEGMKEIRHDSVIWFSDDVNEFQKKAAEVGILTIDDIDVRSLKMLLIYGLKGISAYAHHAAVLGYEDERIHDFIREALISTTKDLSLEEMVKMVMRAGECAVNTMALLDKANTATYGHPEISKVRIGVRNNPGILISGHDLKDLEELLNQTEGTGVDIYTHGEMLPANAYPAFKKYPHLVGNYGSSWWRQNEEFEAFNGPILMTTNCIIPVRDSYRYRIFTTGVVGYPGVKHIPERQKDGVKDFSEIIALAKKCAPPKELETGELVTGFARNQVLDLTDKIVGAVKSGAIRRFIVMAGCDGRHKTRSYYTEVAQNLPGNTVILTAGCAKYRYNKLHLGEIDGIPRVLDAGQCNDCYSLAVIALKLKEVLGLKDLNDLPISFDVAWYEQKAVAVLLALLYLGVKGMRLGPTIPAFISPSVLQVLVDNFQIKTITDHKRDVEAMMAGD